MRLAFLHSPVEPPADTPGWRAIFGNSAWLLMEKAARATLTVGIGAWIARHLGPADFGALSSTLAWVALFGGAAGLGVEAIVVRELVRRPAEQMTIMGTAFVLRMTGGLIAAALAIGIAAVSSLGLTPTLVAIASLITLFGLGETADLWFQAQLQARQAAIGRLLPFVAACALRIGLILSGAPLAAFLWVAVLEAALTAATLGILFLNPRETSLGWSSQLAKDFLRESWPNIIANIAAMGYIRADRVMLAWLAGDAAAGHYSAAASLIEVWAAIPLALTNSATPVLTQIHSSDPRRYQQELARLARLQAGIGWALAAALAIGAPVIVPLLFGANFASAAPVLMALAASLPFSFLGLAAVPWYLNERLTVAAMRRHLLGAALNIVLNLLLIPRYGAPGAAVATTIAFAAAHVFANALDPRTRPVFALQWRALLFLPATPRIP